MSSNVTTIKGMRWILLLNLWVGSAWALPCQRIAGQFDYSNVEILGASSGRAGSPLTFQIINYNTCSEGPSITWSNTNVTPPQSGSSMTVTFSSPGRYLISARLQNTQLPTNFTTLTKVVTIVSNQPSVSGPQVVGQSSSQNFELVLPMGFQIRSASWDFGDGTPLISGIRFVSHTYNQVGIFNLTVRVVNSGPDVVIGWPVNVVASSQVAHCARDMGIFGPTVATVGNLLALQSHVPPCFSVSGPLQWTFNHPGLSSQADWVRYIFDTEGSNQIGLKIGATQFSHSVQAMSGSLATITDSTCPGSGITRDTFSALQDQKVGCGFDGQKNQSSKLVVSEACHVQSTGSSTTWNELSKTTQIVNEGMCLGQSCLRPDGTRLADGAQQIFFTSSNPAGSCTDATTTRTCVNGLWSGESALLSLSCRSGCGVFGPDGTVQTQAVIGQVSVPKVCANAEPNISDVYHNIADQTCTDGQIINSNLRLGGLESAGQCPIYQWTATEQWTNCSMDCGGTQTRIYECRRSDGTLAEAHQCKDASPIEQRLCDGNPSAVEKVEKVATEQFRKKSLICPRGHVGAIHRTRQWVTTRTYACVNHTVAVVNEVQNLEFFERSRDCRKIERKQCEGPQLTPKEVEGLFDWMLKCQKKDRVIAEFLTQFAHIVDANGDSLLNERRKLYPAFTIMQGSGEVQDWRPPTARKASCTVPSGLQVREMCWIRRAEFQTKKK